MALTVEDGTIVANADSYISLVDAATYHTAMGNTAWAALANDTLREQYLRRACQQMEARYKGGWAGSKRNDSTTVTYQPLSWPRKDVTDEDGIALDSQTIPKIVKDAQCEIALMLAGGSEFLRKEITANEVSISSESVGPISVSYTHGSGSQSFSSFPLIDMMLAPVCNTSQLRATVSFLLSDAEKDAFAAYNNGGDFDPADYPDFFL